ncbi:MAG: DNA repair protein RadA [Chloroflexi bacterium]|nr:DNA repair protein RadA [Chloroflexota bacterium]
MAKPRARSRLVCRECGSATPRWVGRCPQCGAWNSLVEEAAIPPQRRPGPVPSPQSLAELPVAAQPRLATSLTEFDRVLGGGVVPGSLILLGGDPGVGKSTLVLQVAAELARAGHTVLYVSGEESLDQLRLRADRLDAYPERLLAVPETDLEAVESWAERIQPALLIVDSIQTLSLAEVGASPGSVTQLRECTIRLMQWAKSSSSAVLLIGHVTKDGTIAGPRVIEHIVDVVLYLEGERLQSYRLLRGTKNRFGSTAEVGVFAMRGNGLAEVPDPSAMFLSERSRQLPGSTVVVSMEGSRPFLVEVQALTAPTGFSFPRRTAAGVDVNRVTLLATVLTKRAGLPLASQDVYVNVVGGLQLSEPAADLGIVLAIASSYRDEPLPSDVAVFGEVGLAGELRAVTALERRLAEAARLGFQRCLLPPLRQPLDFAPAVTLLEAATVREAIALVLRQ